MIIITVFCTNAAEADSGASEHNIVMLLLYEATKKNCTVSKHKLTTTVLYCSAVHIGEMLHVASIARRRATSKSFADTVCRRSDSLCLTVSLRMSAERSRLE